MALHVDDLNPGHTVHSMSPPGPNFCTSEAKEKNPANQHQRCHFTLPITVLCPFPIVARTPLQPPPSQALWNEKQQDYGSKKNQHSHTLTICCEKVSQTHWTSATSWSSTFSVSGSSKQKPPAAMGMMPYISMGME